MASESVKRTNYASGILTLNQSHDGNGNWNVPHQFILQQKPELVKREKFPFKDYATCNAFILIFNHSAIRDNAYNTYDSHFKAYYRLLLFPFHGFW
jgi:hypothetical protein